MALGYHVVIICLLVLVLSENSTMMALAQNTSAPAPGNSNNNQTTTSSSGSGRGQQLRIAVPVRNVFKEFATVERDPTTGEQIFTGFSIDVFKAVVNTALSQPFDYRFIPFAKSDGTMNSSYDDMLKAVFFEDYDGAVADIAITYPRTEWVDFTLPYSETGITMLVRKAPTKEAAIISLMPLIKGLASGVLAFFFLSSLVFWLVEYKRNNREAAPPPSAQAHAHGVGNHEDLLSKKPVGTFS